MNETLDTLGYRRINLGYYCKWLGHGNVIIFEPADNSVSISSFPYSYETKLSINELKAIMDFANNYFDKENSNERETG